ncbi:hypothetical protein B0H13DRAFT_1870708 [Mycena leptocephala]|nr:hypothetical protein B0H13DRAFT_1870708 [Mycena leptocephala]
MFGPLALWNVNVRSAMSEAFLNATVDVRSEAGNLRCPSLGEWVQSNSLDVWDELDMQGAEVPLDAITEDDIRSARRELTPAHVLQTIQDAHQAGVFVNITHSENTIDVGYSGLHGPADPPVSGGRTLLEQRLFDNMSTEQRTVHDTIVQHLDRMIGGEDTEQLLIFWEELFNQEHRYDLPSSKRDFFAGESCADWDLAGLINGTTLHHWAVKFVSAEGMVLPGLRVSRSIHRGFISGAKYLLMDHTSFVSGELFARLAAAMAFKADHNSPNELPFGGTNVILFGDMHQLLPVAGSALHSPRNDSPVAQRGTALYRRFQSIIDLPARLPVVDEQWTSLLMKVRAEVLDAADFDLLSTRTLTDIRCATENFVTARDVCFTLLSMWKSMCKMWNIAALRKHAANVGCEVYTSTALDSIAQHPPSQRERLAIAGMPESRKPAPDVLNIAIGMPVFVHTSSSIVFAEVLDIELDPRERLPGVHNAASETTELLFLPLRIFCRPYHSREDIMGVEPVHSSFGCGAFRVLRLQFPIKAAFAMTIWEAQGLPLHNVLVDFNHYGRTLTRNQIYSALCRARTANNILFLSAFNATALTTPPPMSLLPA